MSVEHVGRVAQKVKKLHKWWKVTDSNLSEHLAGLRDPVFLRGHG